jgi:transcription termination factor Rho
VQKDSTHRVIDLIAPIGMGQRALIVAPPRTGKTVMLQKHRQVHHRQPPRRLPHGAADRRAAGGGDRHGPHREGEVVASTFDEPATRHVQVTEMVLEKAKRLVEHKRDVVILLDFHHAPGPRLQLGGAILGQGADGRRGRQRAAAAEALLRRGAQHRGGRLAHHHRHRADRHRQPHGRGDLRGVQGHRQLGAHPDRKLSDKRTFPAIDITKSGTRKEELLVDRGTLSKMWVLRRILNPMGTQDAMEFLLDKLKYSKTNQDFFDAMNT